MHQNQNWNAPDARMTNNYAPATWIEGQINNNRILQSILNQGPHPLLAGQFQSKNMVRPPLPVPNATAFNNFAGNYEHTVHINKMANWQGPDPNVNIYGSGKDPPHPVGRHGAGALKRSSDHVSQVNTVAKRTHTGIGNVNKDIQNSNPNITKGPLYRYQHGYGSAQPYRNVTKPCDGVASWTNANIEGYNATPGLHGPAHVMQAAGSEPIPENPRHVGPQWQQQSVYLKDCLPDLAAEIMILIPHMDEIEPTVYEKPYYRDTLTLVICVECNYTIFADAPACRDLRLHSEMYRHSTHNFNIIKMGTPKLRCATCRIVSQKDTTFYVVESLVHHQRQHHPYIENPHYGGAPVDVPSCTNVHAPQQQGFNPSPTDIRRFPPSVPTTPGMNRNLEKANGSNQENCEIVRMQPTTDRVAMADQRAAYNAIPISGQTKTHTTHKFQNGESKQIDFPTLNHDGMKSTQQSSNITYSDDVQITTLDRDKTQKAEKGQVTASSGSKTQTNNSCSVRNALELIELPRSIQQRHGSQTLSANSTQATHHPFLLTQSIHNTTVSSDSKVNTIKDNMPGELGPKGTNMLSDTMKRYQAEVPGVRIDLQGRKMSNGSQGSIAAWDPVINPEKIITIQPEPPYQTEQRDRHINPLDNRDDDVCSNPADSHNSFTNQKPDTCEGGNDTGMAIGGTGVGDEHHRQLRQQRQCSGDAVDSNHQDKRNLTVRQNATPSINRPQNNISSSIPCSQTPVDSRAQQMVSDVPTTPPSDVHDNRFEHPKGARQTRGITSQQTNNFVSATHEDNKLDTHRKDMAREDSSVIMALQLDFPGVQILQQSDMSFRSPDVVVKSAGNHELLQAGIQQQNIPQEIILQNGGAPNMNTVIDKIIQYKPGDEEDQIGAGSRAASSDDQPDATATPTCRYATSQTKQDPTRTMSNYANNSDASSEPPVVTAEALHSMLDVKATANNDQFNFDTDNDSLSNNNLVIDFDADSEPDLEQDPYKVFLVSNWSDRVSTSRMSERASPALTIGYEEGLQDDLENSEKIYRPDVEDVTPEGSIVNFPIAIEASPTKYGRQLETSPKISRKHEMLISELSTLTSSKYHQMVSSPNDSLPRYETSDDRHASDDEDDCMIIDPP